MNYDLTLFRGDIFGGITSMVVALPVALGFGVASGMGAAARSAGQGAGRAEAEKPNSDSMVSATPFDGDATERVSLVAGGGIDL